MMTTNHLVRLSRETSYNHCELDKIRGRNQTSKSHEHKRIERVVHEQTILRRGGTYQVISPVTEGSSSSRPSCRTKRITLQCSHFNLLSLQFVPRLVVVLSPEAGSCSDERYSPLRAGLSTRLELPKSRRTTEQVAAFFRALPTVMPDVINFLQIWFVQPSIDAKFLFERKVK